jgi:hypothetical protein
MAGLYGFSVDQMRRPLRAVSLSSTPAATGKITRNSRKESPL